MKTEKTFGGFAARLNGAFSGHVTGIVNISWYISAMHILAETNKYSFFTLAQIGSRLT